MRSFTLEHGLKLSSFASTLAPAGTTLFNRTSGVLPMSSVTSLAIFILYLLSQFVLSYRAEQDGEATNILRSRETCLLPLPSSIQPRTDFQFGMTVVFREALNIKCSRILPKQKRPAIRSRGPFGNSTLSYLIMS